MRLAATIMILLLLAACARVVPPAPRITMSPAADTASAPTERGLTVTADGGRLTSVLAYAGRDLVPGSFDASHATWHSSWTLRPGTEYVVNAVAVGRDGVAAQIAGRFRTLRPQHTLAIDSLTPADDETVGVGMPIIVTFTGPVQDRAAVERALEVRSGVEGAWHWFGDQQVVYRTRSMWPARQKVVLDAHLAGVRAGPGTYGTADRTVSFEVGRAMVSTVDARTHQMVVKQDGEVAQRMAVSAGMGTTEEYTTTSGVHLTMDKANPVRMISPGREKGEPGYYDEVIDYAVRISNSGEYVHAMDNEWAQGRANVSHGCINARPDQAEWFYEHALRGDPVIITGTTRKLTPDNGWGFWQFTWADWLSGSELPIQS